MNVINDIVARLILSLSNLGETFWEHLTLSQYSFWQTGVDIFIVAFLFYWLIMLLKGTRAVHILTGLAILGVFYTLSRWLELLAVNWILSRIFPVILLAIPIIFQKELRRGLEHLGKTPLLGNQIEGTDRIISDIIEACQELVKHGHGALLVFQRDIKLEEYLETGEELDAHISKDLLVSIFQPKSPLHDGAVIVQGRRLAAAGCTLPHDFKRYDPKYGTRHKAGIGLSENTDAEVIVISEERKTISHAFEGKIKELTTDELQVVLENIFKPKKPSKKS
ncbi:TIGR00159 family protein [Candidatus Peregrinibacteria bacterium]|jgi:diadenylate cyclase|nr:TIGR00159 family protein [Candidatus Peregrinibacteria bacterium]MBT7483253.1 TIGR00159 family protein [Candidatus Peregrinibacteria bacterium]MBT7703007.1 TIGR00159 family protein [Candidatus Peregrinibacteria bacterium]